MDTPRRIYLLFTFAVIMVLLFFCALNPPKVEAVPSYARQTGLACSGCHYAPPELNPAGRRFKLLGYVDRADETKVIKTDGGKKRAALDLLSSLPLSIMFETSFTSTKSPVPGSQNGSVELPQDISLFLSGAWTTHVGSFLQVTYDTQDDHFTSDNTDIRYANKTKLGGKELVYGLDLNNNPTVQDLWNTTPAWGFPYAASNLGSTPGASTMIEGAFAAHVVGLGAYTMINDMLYLEATGYRTLRFDQQNSLGVDPFQSPGLFSGVAPYWRVALEPHWGPHTFMLGTYGMIFNVNPWIDSSFVQGTTGRNSIFAQPLPAEAKA